MKIANSLFLALFLILLVGVPAFASDVSDALYYGTITVSNNGTATTYVSTNMTLSTQNLIDGNFCNDNATDIAVQDSNGSDVAFMPGWSTNPWCLFVPSIGVNTQLYDTLYTNATDGKLRYFPAAGGMTTTDNDTSLELGDNFTIEQKGWVDTSAGTHKVLIYKPNAFATYVSGTENVSSFIFSASDNATNQTWYGTGYNNDFAFYSTAWKGQTFTLASPCLMTYATIYASKSGAPSTATFYIKNVAGGLPTGSSQTSVDVDPSGWSLGWHTIDFPDILLASGTYCLLASSPSSTVSNWPVWGADNTTPTYTGGTYLTSSDSGGSWTSDGGVDFLFEIYGIQPTKSVTKSGVSSAEHTVTTTADGSDFWISVDGAVGDNVSLGGASVSNNANVWTFLQNDVMPYMEYQKIWIDGVLVQHITWQYAATFSDQSGYSNPATPTFRTASSDADVSAALTSFQPVHEAKAPDSSLTVSGDPFMVVPTPSGNFTTAGTSVFTPLKDLVEAVSGTDTPPQLLYIIICAISILGVSLLFSWFARQVGSGTLFIKIAIIVAIMGIFVAIKPLDWWMIIAFLIWAFAMGIASRHRGWA